MQEAFLQRVIIEEFFPVHIFFERIERVTVAFMQIDQHVQMMLFTPAAAIFQITEAGRNDVAIFVLQYIVVYRDTYMIVSERCDIRNILFCNKAVKMRFVIFVELGDPAA